MMPIFLFIWKRFSESNNFEFEPQEFYGPCNSDLPSKLVWQKLQMYGYSPFGR